MGLFTGRYFLLNNIQNGRILYFGFQKAVGHSRVTRVRFPPFYYDHEKINNNAKVILIIMTLTRMMFQ